MDNDKKEEKLPTATAVALPNIFNPIFMYDPKDIFFFLSFYSPVIIAFSMLFVSFFLQSFKGIIFNFFLFGTCILRYLFYLFRSSKKKDADDSEKNETADDDTNDSSKDSAKSICNSVEYTKFGNSTISTFVFGFTIMYLLLPMFVNNSINFLIIQILLIYSVIDLYIKQSNKCLPDATEVMLNFLGGLFCGAAIIGFLYAGGSTYIMFFNEIQSNKEVCTMPSKQTFKCQVYKNGELIGNM
jgi:hypothetical protein